MMVLDGGLLFGPPCMQLTSQQTRSKKFTLLLPCNRTIGQPVFLPCDDECNRPNTINVIRMYRTSD